MVREKGADVASIESYDEAEFDRLMAMNLRSIFLGMRHVIPVMLAQGAGAVVNRRGKSLRWQRILIALPVYVPGRCEGIMRTSTQSERHYDQAG